MTAPASPADNEHSAPPPGDEETRPTVGAGTSGGLVGANSHDTGRGRQERTILADALDLAHSDLTKYIVFPSPEAADAVTLFIAATHCQDIWEHATRLILKSPVKRCGKTRAAEIIRELVHKPLVAGSISAAALVRAIDTDPPTLVLDEADTVFGKKSDESGEALRQILNLGHSRGWPYLRWDPKKREMELCPTFAMAVIAGIGNMPDTIEDRAVVISMQRRAPGETVAPYRQRDAADLHQVRFTIEKAMLATLGQNDEFDSPALPVEDRAADVWEPLFAVAVAAGGDWPERARRACLALVADDEEEQTMGLKLLADLYAVWGDADHLATATILERLHDLDESPWPNYYGRPLNPRDLGKLLRPYKVTSKTIRLPEGSNPPTLKGYTRAELYPAWERYTNEKRDRQTLDPGEASQASQASQGHTSDTDKHPLTRDVTDVTDVTDKSDRVTEGPNVTDGVPPTDDRPRDPDTGKVLCRVCALPMDAALGTARSHPACDPDEVVT